MASPRFSDSLARLAMAAVVLLTGVLYLHALGSAPINLSVDESRFAVHAHAIATTGRDLSGSRFPLFFHIVNPLAPGDWSDTWWQPMLFYVMAAAFRGLALSEWSVRLPVACLAILNVVLIYFVARRLFANRWYGTIAAALLALTPAHFIFGRQAMDYFCQLPIALTWLWGLCLYVERPRAWLPPAIGLLLGVGLFCHISSWVVMPFYLLITLTVVWITAQSWRACAALVMGFAVALLPLVPWLWLHPSTPRDMLTNYKVGHELRLADRVETYWDYFNPSFLFFSGGSNPMFATRRAGVFLLPAAVLLPLGLWAVARRGWPILLTVVVIGFFFAPIPIIAAMPQDPKYYTPRDLLALPFGALLCTAGIHWLLENRGRVARSVAVALLIAAPLQFTTFARDYFTEYQTWSAARFDAFNLRGVAAAVIARDGVARVPAIYLSEDIGEPQAEQWLFYLLAQGRRDLFARSRHMEVARVDLDQMPSGSLLVMAAMHPQRDRLLGADRCSLVQVIAGADGSPAAAILRRD